MKSVRVVLAVVALLALPFGSVAAQSRGGNKPRPRTASEIADCKAEHAAALARAEAEGHSPFGLDKKCTDPVPPPPPPAPQPPPPPPPPAPPPPPPSGGYPTGIHEARGVVYEDVDGSGSQDVFAGEMGLPGWTIQLFWDGQLVATATTDAEGMYLFPGLGNSNRDWWVCVIPQAGYNRTQPANGDACAGNGMIQRVDSPFMTRMETNFGEMLQ